MVGKKPPTPGCSSRKTPGEPALAQRLRRNISPKNLDLTAGLSWREERELNKALYASLQETKKLTLKSELDLDSPLVPSNSIPRRNLLARVLPRRQSPRSSKPVAPVKSNMSMRSPTLPPPSDKRLKSQHSIGGDESSQDSMRSSTTSCSNDDLKGRTKVRAQRKFAQMHAYGNTMVPSQHTPVKQSSKTSSPIKVFPKRAKTEDFLTFLCLRGKPVLPPHLDFFNFSRDEGDTSLPPTPPNRSRVFVRESSPSSSSTSCSNVPDEVADSPAPLVMPPSGRVTPSRKAARACAGTPETARGLASFPSRQGQRSQATSKRRQGYTSPAITPAKLTRSYRNGTPSPMKGTRGKASPGKMTDAERLCIKRKAIATLTSSKLSPDKKSRRKSLFVDQSEMDEKPGRQRQTKVTSDSDTSSVVSVTNSCGQEARNGEGVSRSCNVVDINLPEVSSPSIADVVYACSITPIAKSTTACCTSNSPTTCSDDDDSKTSKLYSSGMILPAGLKSSLINKFCSCHTQTPSLSSEEVIPCTEAVIPCPSETPSISVEESIPYPTKTLSVSAEGAVPSPTTQTHSTQDVIFCPTKIHPVSSEDVVPYPTQTHPGSTEDVVSYSTQTHPLSIEDNIPYPTRTHPISTEDVVSCPTQTNPISTEDVIPCPTQTNPIYTEDVVPCPTQTNPVSTEDVIPYPTRTHPVSTEDVVPFPTQTHPVSTEDIIPCPTQTNPISTEDVIPCPTQTHPVSTEEIVPCPTQTNPVSTEDVIPCPTQTHPVSTEDIIPYPTQTNPLSIEDIIPCPTQTNPVSTEDVVSCPTQSNPISTEDIIPCPTQTNPVSTEDVVSCPTQTHPVSTEDVIPCPTQTNPVSTEDIIPYPTQTHPVSTEDVVPCPTQTNPLSIDDVVPYPTQINPVSTEDVIPYPTQTHPVSTEDVIPSPTQTHPIYTEDVIPGPTQSHPVSTEDVIPCPTQTHPVSTEDVVPCPTQTNPISTWDVIPYPTQTHPVYATDAIPYPTQTNPISPEDVIPYSTQTNPISSWDVIPFPTQTNPISTEDVIPYSTQTHLVSSEEIIPCSSKLLDSSDSLPRPFPAYVPLFSTFGPFVKDRFNTESVKSECQSRYLDIEVRKNSEHDIPYSYQSQPVFDSNPNIHASETLLKSESENQMHFNLSPCLKVSSDNIFHSEMTLENTDKSTQTETDTLPSMSDTALAGLGDDSPSADKIKKVVTLPQQIVKMTTPVSVGCVVNIDDSGFIDGCLDSPTLTSPFPKSLPKHKGILAKYKYKTSTPYLKSKTRKETFVSFLLPPMSASPKVQSHAQTLHKSPVKASSTSKIMRIDPPTSNVIAPPACHMIASPTSNFTTSPVSEPSFSGKSVVHARVNNCPIRASASILPHPAPPYSVLTSIREQKLAMKSLDAVSILSSANEIQPSDGLRPSVRTLFPPPPTLCYRGIPQ
ncbi:flocculation protein FLO11-like isoform X2 [Mizuhopecten yessoensis]|uniref:flocculation protein FLO11-like isoform X2 n=1 Tax=Mizuhopecten yessoensis TaxID=6573 RepID=UPI000B45ADB5|nr:flocculation protein FLO11-like isoform X2 [Mizuhopecten yessoensis]